MIRAKAIWGELAEFWEPVGGVELGANPWFIGFQISPTSAVPKTLTADAATHIRALLAGSASMLCRHNPPSSGCHCSRVGC
jgi:hypothetical protein